MLTYILLAAGLSRRMGKQNKLSLPLGQKPLLLHMCERLLDADPGELLVVLGHESNTLLPIIEGLPCKQVINPDFALGMTSSIQAGVSAASSASKGYMICLADLPLIESAEYGFLARQFLAQYPLQSPLIQVPTWQGKRGHPVIFSQHFRPHLLAHTEPEGCKGILQANPDAVTTVAMQHPHILQDMDTPQAYQSFIKL